MIFDGLLRIIKNKISCRRNYMKISVTDEEMLIIKRLALCQKKTVNEFIKYLVFSKYIDDFIR